jgi:cobalamin biosynthesis protein CbiD
MTDQKLKKLLNSLQDTLERTEQVDAETLALVHELDEEIHRLTETGAQADDVEGVLDQAKSMETRFAVDHPVAERFLREIIDALSRVGI